ncbi:unnamed protein product [Paramecium octaurelia]|uniref:Transmembrane protein n=1 Tax=Paramecium octaurelia TaxID=43137 RepID=A0A8S1TAZ5_PAROT|nr:unnamed protein product [Paramecium octaurelia]
MIDFLQESYSLDNKELRQSALIDIQIAEQIEIDQSDQQHLPFGIWSKYNPLGLATLKDAYGLFDSNCFQIINSVDYATQSLNFIQYDCVYDTTKEIKKFIQIGFSQTDQFIFSIQIEPSEYEDIWYFFYIITNISKKRVELTISSQLNVIFKETLELILPKRDQKLLFTFGGSFKVENSNILLIEKGRIFSLYPGQLIVYNFEMKRISIDFDYWLEITQFYEEIQNCECVTDLNMNEVHLLFLDVQTNLLQNINCNSYTLAGWLKISQIHQSSEEFIYQFLKISTSIEGIETENLATFQLYYHISSVQNKIIITTYQYDFPSVTQDFSNDPFIIRRELIIYNNITSWQYIYINLQENRLDFSIIFYEASSSQSYETIFNVKQFHNQQLKISCGNIQQTKLDYLDVIVRSQLFSNCMQDLKQQKCHQSCKECDGPTKYHCLSCSKELKRIYIPEFKQCDCQYGTVDYNNACIDYIDQYLNLNLQLNVKQRNNLNCKMGYFELDGDCIKCPSRIYRDFLNCFECFSQPDTWFQKPYCSLNLEFTKILGQYERPITQNFYLHDSSDLISTNIPWYDVGGISIKNERLLYEYFQLSLQIFVSLCNSQKSNISGEHSCYACDIRYCQSCGLTQNKGIFCLKCEYPKELVNGRCTDYEIFNYTSCLPPYYASFSRKCELCPIENCIYCFEFVYNGGFQMSIEFSDLFNKEDIQIGCLLCEKDYNYNFYHQRCIKKAPTINNCVTSVTKPKNEEICLTSSLDNFQVSKEINHCGSLISYCSVCFIDYNNKITCLKCESGYVLFDGFCYYGEEESGYALNEYWNTKVKSFLINFYQYYDYIEPLKSYPCGNYCKTCKYSLGEYQCEECYLDTRDEDLYLKNYMCKSCQPYCLLCNSRYEIDISVIAPFLLTTYYKTLYTYQCLFPILDPNIYYNPYLKTTQYCLEGDCSNELTYEFFQNHCGFSRFPKQIDDIGIQTEYLNSIGAVSMTIVIRIELEGDFCFLSPTIATTASIKFLVFTLQIIHLKLLATSPFYMAIFGQIYIQEYDSFTMIGFGIILDFDMTDFNVSNSKNEVSFTLINNTIKDSLVQNVQSIFKTKNFGDVNLKNISIINTQFVNSSLFNFNSFNLIGEVKINQLQLFNCTLTDSILFEFSYTQFPIKFINFTMDQQLIIHQIFKYIYQTYQFRDLKLSQSQFLYCSQQVDVIANNLVFNFNQLLDSIIFGFSSGLNSSQIEVKNNIFIQSSFMTTIQLIAQQLASCNLMYIIIRNNKLQNSNLFKFFSEFQSNDLIIRFQNVLIEYNEGLITLNQVSYMFNINGNSIILDNFQIYQTKKISILNLFDSQNVELLNFIVENSEMEEKISVTKSCLQNINFQNQIVSIVNFNTISISNLKIKYIQSMDESIIKILSNSQYFQEKISQLTIINIEFYGNLLQSLNQNLYFSLITIISDRNLDIQIKNVVFLNNIMHEYNENSLRDSAALFYISTLASTIQIENLYCKYNAMTNSSNSFIHIAAKSLKMHDVHVRNHNILPFSIWNYYYNLIQGNQDQIQSQIMQVFLIKTIGGAAYIQTSNFLCINSSFEEIMAAKISVFDIVTSSDGTVMMQNLSVISTRNSFEESVESAGCLSVNAIKSILYLQIKNAKFQNILNRMASSIITINPSIQKNKLRFQNMSIINCVSLKNQIVKVQFIIQANKYNSISFTNLMIRQNLESWVDLFSNTGTLSDSEIQDIIGKDNAMIYLENCDATLENLFFEGMLFSSILNLNNINSLNMLNCSFYNVQNIYTQNLIQITQSAQQQQSVSLRYLNFKYGSMYIIDHSMNQEYLSKYNKYFIFGCFIQSFSVESLEKNYFYSNTIQLVQQNQQQTSIIYVKSYSNQGVFIFDRIQFQNNNYSATYQGIIHFDNINFKRFQIIRFDCNYNFINKYGCLNIIGNQNASNLFEVKNSHFISNLGTQGVAIKSSDIILKIKKCKIISNIALSQGGGLYLQLNSKKFYISETIIIDNKAQQGGGIYYEQDNDLSMKTQDQTFIYFNQAELYGNNLVENPSYLQLYINSKAMNAIEQKINNISTSILKMSPYIVMEQGITKYTEMLMLPSTQVIDTYQIFFLNEATFLTYIKTLKIVFKNSKGEVLHNNYNSTCEVSDYIVTKETGEKQKSSLIQHLLYQTSDNNFELNTLVFRLDPYKQENRHLEIQIFCKTQNSQNGLNYIINAKSFKCQLGEFYIEDGCQICKFSQGFYSVTYDAIKCSIFDKTKFQTVTSNMINLKKGFWRPNHLSDATEECYKNAEFCQGGWEVGDSICIKGHIGALCEMCDLYNIRGEGQYIRSQQNSQCVSCSNEQSSIFPFIFTLFQALLSLTLSLKSINKSNSLFSSLSVFQHKFSKILFKLNQDHEGILIKILLNYLWIFSSIFTFNIKFSFSIFFIEQSSNSFQFMVNNLDCYLSDLQIHLIYAQIIVLILLMLLQFYFMLIVSFIYHQLSSQKMDKSIISNTLLCLYVFNYGGLIKFLCSKLSIRQISNIDYIQGDVSLMFNSQEHQLWVQFLIIPLLLIFGGIIPISLFLLMLLNRFHLYKIQFRKHICYLFNEYNENRYYWEQIKLIQKLCIILIMTNFENNLLFKTTLLGLCLEAYQVLAINNKPYIISKFNKLDLQSGQICLIAIFLAATKYESQVLQNNVLSMFLQTILIVLLFRLSFPFIKDILSIYFKKYSTPILTKLNLYLRQSKINIQKILEMVWIGNFQKKNNYK